MYTADSNTYFSLITDNAVILEASRVFFPKRKEVFEEAFDTPFHVCDKEESLNMVQLYIDQLEKTNKTTTNFTLSSKSATLKEGDAGC